MRWTKEAEEMLWQTVFKTHTFHMDLAQISKAWPGDDKPTPKALKEHMAKYRKKLGGDTRITFGMGSKKDTEGSTVIATPRKRRASGKDGDSAPATPTKNRMPGEDQGLGADVVVKEEEIETAAADEGDGDDEESDDVKLPTPKRIKMEMEENGYF
ncbi:hypothetical protein BDW62DRAFT_199572 [Aspergillus aurantiobrunneus]